MKGLQLSFFYFLNIKNKAGNGEACLQSQDSGDWVRWMDGPLWVWGHPDQHG